MPNSLVFITGATGFIGSHVVAYTLEAGYRVRLSIRKAEQEQAIKKRYPKFTSEIETVVIPDITKSSSFADALNGVDYVFHLASPMPGKVSDFQAEYVHPAVQGTLAVLRAALDFPQIEKVIVMSSVLALLPPTAAGGATEVVVTDNTGEVIPIDLDMSFPEGFTGHGMKYSASKVLAHQATRDFLKTYRPHYTLITFHPTFVLGDSLVQENAENIDGINGLFWSSLFSEKPIIKNAWVHVRDVAEAHIKALNAHIETGMEFLLSAPPVNWEEVVKFVKTTYPGLGCKLELPIEGGWKVDTSTAERVLEINWRSKETIIQDVVNQQLELRAGGSNAL